MAEVFTTDVASGGTVQGNKAKGLPQACRVSADEARAVGRPTDPRRVWHLEGASVSEAPAQERVSESPLNIPAYSEAFLKRSLD